jgi:hypothetical protein
VILGASKVPLSLGFDADGVDAQRALFERGKDNTPSVRTGSSSRRFSNAHSELINVIHDILKSILLRKSTCLGGRASTLALRVSTRAEVPARLVGSRWEIRFHTNTSLPAVLRFHVLRMFSVWVRWADAMVPSRGRGAENSLRASPYALRFLSCNPCEKPTLTFSQSGGVTIVARY